jgi:flagellar biosynthetic protein FliR
MEFLLSDINKVIYSCIWPMLRISALLATAPFFSIKALPLRIRILIGLSLTIFIYPEMTWPVIDPFSAPGVLEIVNQIFIGCLMGLVMQIVVSAVIIAGQVISNANGLSMATLMDPSMGNVPVISQFLLILATLIFMGTGGHLILISALLESFISVPIGASLLDPIVWGKLLSWSSLMFAGGLMMALPVMATMLVINAGLGVVTRAAPSLNIFSIGFPALIVAGLLATLFSLESIGLRIEWLWQKAFSTLSDILQVS